MDVEADEAAGIRRKGEAGARHGLTGEDAHAAHASAQGVALVRPGNPRETRLSCQRRHTGGCTGADADVLHEEAANALILLHGKGSGGSGA